MIVPWTIGGLLRDLTVRGGHPAVISFANDGVVTWGSKALAEQALSLARDLREEGVGGGVRSRSGRRTRPSGSRQVWASG